MVQCKLCPASSTRIGKVHKIDPVNQELMRRGRPPMAPVTVVVDSDDQPEKEPRFTRKGYLEFMRIL
jgi:hypothetical protein